MTGRFKDLLDLALDHRLDVDERLELEGYLRFPPDARQYFAGMMELANMICCTISHGVAGASLMVVEDRAIDQKIAVRFACRSGFDVEVDGHEAIAKFEPFKLQVVMLDMVLEGGPDGLATYRALRELDPDVRVLICTGHVESVRVKQALLEGVRGVLQKPYSQDQLVAGIFLACGG
ncbi:MAG: two-component system chemotaxis response regulator CheY [Kiritimatiellia bacterium]|jgi:two-component system chemotaxis response regulator CheY